MHPCQVNAQDQISEFRTDAASNEVGRACNGDTACHLPSVHMPQRAARPSSTRLWPLLESRLVATTLALPQMMTRGTKRRTIGMRKCERHLATMS